MGLRQSVPQQGAHLLHHVGLPTLHLLSLDKLPLQPHHTSKRWAVWGCTHQTPLLILSTPCMGIHKEILMYLNLGLNLQHQYLAMKWHIQLRPLNKHQLHRAIMIVPSYLTSRFNPQHPLMSNPLLQPMSSPLLLPTHSPLLQHLHTLPEQHPHPLQYFHSQFLSLTHIHTLSHKQ